MRFARTRFERPVVDLARLADAGGRAQVWVRDTLVPKVVVATQTRVGEAAVDQEGRWVASTPTVALVADPELLWRIAAVVCSPVGSVAATLLLDQRGPLVAPRRRRRLQMLLFRWHTQTRSSSFPVTDSQWRRRSMPSRTWPSCSKRRVSRSSTRFTRLPAVCRDT